MKAYRVLSGVGFAAALGVSVWQILARSGEPGISALIFTGAALGLFLVGFTLPPVKAWRHAALAGVGFLLLAPGTPAGFLMGSVAGLGTVMLWQAYQIKTGEGGK